MVGGIVVDVEVDVDVVVGESVVEDVDVVVDGVVDVEDVEVDVVVGEVVDVEVDVEVGSDVDGDMVLDVVLGPVGVGVVIVGVAFTGVDAIDFAEVDVGVEEDGSSVVVVGTAEVVGPVLEVAIRAGSVVLAAVISVVVVAVLAVLVAVVALLAVVVVVVVVVAALLAVVIFVVEVGTVLAVVAVGTFPVVVVVVALAVVVVAVVVALAIVVVAVVVALLVEVVVAVVAEVGGSVVGGSVGRVCSEVLVGSTFFVVAACVVAVVGGVCAAFEGPGTKTKVATGASPGLTLAPGDAPAPLPWSERLPVASTDLEPPEASPGPSGDVADFVPPPGATEDRGWSESTRVTVAAIGVPFAPTGSGSGTSGSIAGTMSRPV